MDFDELLELVNDNVNCALFDNNYSKTIESFKIIRQYIIGCYFFKFITYKQMTKLLKPIDNILVDLEAFGVRKVFNV